MIKIGLIGAGFMGSMHAACYKALAESGVKVVAVADLDPAKAAAVAAKTGAKIYQYGKTLIEEADVDAIDICLPTYLHAEHAIMAMNRGRHVFVEKPVCLNSEQALKMKEAQDRNGVQAMVGQCLRLWPEYMWLKETTTSGIYGKLKSLSMSRLSPKPTWAWNNWLHNYEQSGSVALDLHVHDADMVRYILGEPDNVSATVARDSDGVIQHIAAAYEYGAGVAAFAEGTWDYPSDFPFIMEYRAGFEKATAVFRSSESPSLVVYLQDGGRIVPEIDKGFEDSNDVGGNISSLGGYFNELKYFTETLMAGKKIRIATLDEGIKTLMLVLNEIETAGGVRKV